MTAMESQTGAAGRVCRRCLLEELGEGDYLESVRRYRARLSEKERTPDDEYEARLSACKDCAELVNATCNLCGCYVEIRAARRSSSCPAIPPRWSGQRSK